MVLNINGAAQAYLADLNRTQQQINQAQAQVSSGFRVQTPSDDPAAVPSILQVQAEIGNNHQIQSNLGSVTNELGTADSALQSAVQAVESAVTLAAQGANSTATAADRTNFAPRLGFAWDVFGNAKTSVRGGFGMFYDILKAEDSLQFNGQAPFFASGYLSFSSPANGFTSDPGIMTDPYGAAGAVNPFPSKPVNHKSGPRASPKQSRNRRWRK